MVTTQLNPAQLNVLSLMAYIDTEQEQQELQDILLQFYRKKTDSLLLQFQKDVSSIDAVFAGIFMLLRLLQSANAFSPIFVIPSGIVTERRLLQPRNVLSGMIFNPFPTFAV